MEMPDNECRSSSPADAPVSCGNTFLGWDVGAGGGGGEEVLFQCAQLLQLKKLREVEE